MKSKIIKVIKKKPEPSSKFTYFIICAIVLIIAAKFYMDSQREKQMASEATQTNAHSKIFNFFFHPPTLTRNITADDKAIFSKLMSGKSYELQTSEFAMPADLEELRVRSSLMGQNLMSSYSYSKPDFGVVTTGELIEALKMKKDYIPEYTFGKKNRNGQLCSALAQVVVLADSPIKELSDLQNRKYSTNYPEYPTMFAVKMFLHDSAALRLKYTVSFSEDRALQLLEQNKIDAVVFNGYRFGENETIFTVDTAPGKDGTPSKYRNLFIYDSKMPCFVVFSGKDVPTEMHKEFSAKLEEGMKDKKNAERFNMLNLTKLTAQDSASILKRAKEVAGWAIKYDDIDNPGM